MVGAPRSTTVTPAATRDGTRRWRYDAFLSYSHHDKDVAQSIHRGLHRVARPIGRLRALRVFRDQTDLAANPDLWDRVVSAMDSSRYLILVASPAAASSVWVTREVAHWLETRGSERVLLVLADGSLEWEDSRHAFDPERSSAAPAPFTSIDGLEVEPLYVDVSGDLSFELSDGAFREHIVELAAPIHGKSKEELFSDDRRELRRYRRWRAGAIVAVVTLMLLAVAAAIVAVQQRNTAEDQRALAVEEADRANARLLAAESASVSQSQNDLALLLASESLEVRPTEEGWAAMAAALTHEARGLTNLSPGTDVESVALHPEGLFVAAAIGDRIELWHPDDRTGPVAVFELQDVESIAVSNDGCRLAPLRWRIGSEP